MSLKKKESQGDDGHDDDECAVKETCFPGMTLLPPLNNNDAVGEDQFVDQYVDVDPDLDDEPTKTKAMRRSSKVSPETSLQTKRNSYDMRSSSQPLPQGILNQYDVAFPSASLDPLPKENSDISFNADKGKSRRNRWALLAFIVLLVAAGVAVAVLMTTSNSGKSTNSEGDASSTSGSEQDNEQTPTSYTAESRFLDVNYDDLIPTPEAEAELIEALKVMFADQAGIDVSKILSIVLSRGSVIVTVTVADAPSKQRIDSMATFCANARVNRFNFDLCVNSIKPPQASTSRCHAAPCKNNGRCMTTSSDTLCGCADGWSGKECDEYGRMPAGTAAILPSSAAGQLLRLVKDCGNTNLGLARSFNEEPWEPILPGLPGRVDLTCEVAANCTVRLPKDGSIFCIQEVDVAHVPTSSDAKAARLLTQGTFGATRNDIDNVKNTLAGDAKAWILEQQAFTPTFLREHFRARTNQRQLVGDDFGTVRSACEAGSRWHSYTFGILDEGKSVTVVNGTVTPGWFTLYIDGTRLTELKDLPVEAGVYVICAVNNEFRQGNSTVDLSTDDCETTITIPNPSIHFESVNPDVIDFTAAAFDTHVTRTDVVFLRAPVSTCTGNVFEQSVIMFTGTRYYRHDPRLKLLENTLDSPADVAASGDSCPSVVETFLNEATCVRRPSCSQPLFESVPVHMNNETIRVWFEESRRYVYFVKGLRLEDPYDISPCKSTKKSRWLRTSGNCSTPTTTMDPDTLVTLATALGESTDSNPFVRDILISGANCDGSSDTIGAQIEVGGECFEHVHPNLYDVRDFSEWVLKHDGNDDAFSGNRRNPIARWAEDGLTYLEFPHHHPMSRFDARIEHFPLVARYGDSIDFTQLNTELQTLEIANFVGATVSTGDDGFESCGSPGETSNNPSKGDWYPASNPLPRHFRNAQLDRPLQGLETAKTMVWANVALSADDQLRQRVAWILSQILVVSDPDLQDEQVEKWVTFYDIFIKHAFGNYRDILQEVTYSPMMGKYLSFIQNKGYADSGTFPDENFAREIMQLFTIGLWKLGDDGLPLVDEDGEKIPTYDDEDIVAFARVWTGFDLQNTRVNIEYTTQNENLVDPMQLKPAWRDPLPKTKLDAGYIGDEYPSCHELPPQHFLREGATFDFMGASSIEGPVFDPYNELPSQILHIDDLTSFAGGRSRNGYFEFREREGAFIEWEFNHASTETVDLRAYYYVKNKIVRYFNLTVNGEVVDGQWEFPSDNDEKKLRPNDAIRISLVAGTNTIRMSSTGDKDLRLLFLAFGGDGAIRHRLTPKAATSELYAALCAAPSASTPCTFPRKVTLPTNLACDGDECGAGRVIVVAIEDPVASVRRFYRYRPRKCVRFPAFSNGHVSVINADARKQCTADHMEMSPRCCETGTTTVLPDDIFAKDCLYANEAMTYRVAAERCAARGGSLCTGYAGSPYLQNACANAVFQWTTQPCTPQLQVYLDGYIGLIDPVTADTDKMWQYKESSRHVFRVYWDDSSAIPSAANGCGPGCEVVELLEGNTCVCNYTSKETLGFGNSSHALSVDEVASKLFIGSVPPTVYDAGMYIECASASFCTDDVRVWTLASSPMEWNTATIFQLPPRLNGGSTRYLMNKVLTVTIDGQPNASFRSPPSFMPSLGEQAYWGARTYLSYDMLTREAEYEVEATLDHFMEHPSTGPFVALRLIQHMVTSNPSPMYVERVVAAFKTGKHGGIGSGKYGDLAATVAAVLLDKEARTQHYDAEPTFGHGFEPTMKVMSILRALEWKSSRGQPLAMKLDGPIGMEVFHSPSVFGFYRPEYAAEGAVSDAQLVSPELQLLQQPLVIGYLNSMVSLIDKGMSSCGDGFGSFCAGVDQELGFEGPLTASFTATDGETIADELALLLTQDRMHPNTRKIIAQAFDEKKLEGAEVALKHAQKLALSSPDFHASGINTVTKEDRKRSKNVDSTGRKFKAIVVVFETGGCDSWNVVVPKGDCRDGRDYYAEYAEVRTNGAIPHSTLLDIELPTGTQPCNRFGVHPSLPLFKQLHDAGEGAFVANIGALVEPVTKEEVQKKTKRLPISLGAHNAQQRHLATVNADNLLAKGVLGRAVQALLEQETPYKSELFSLAGNQRMLDGSDQLYDIVHRARGIKQFNQYEELIDDLQKLTANTSESVFTDTYSKMLRSTLERTRALGDLLDSTETETTFTGTGPVSGQLQEVAKLIKLLKTDLDTERAVFVVTRGGFDTHSSWDISGNLNDINEGMASFVNEMKQQGTWDDVVFFTVSDFGRTLTSNGRGSDHAWGGNHFVGGGQVKGGKMFGNFPDTLKADGSQYVGRGRMVPTVPWEGVWEGIFQWFGVEDSQMSNVLPNLANFGPEVRFTKDELFVDRPRSGATSYAVQWTVPSNPRTLTIKPGDSLAFTWSGYHDLVQTAAGTSGCDFGGATELVPADILGNYVWKPMAAVLEAEQARMVSGATVNLLYVEFQLKGDYIEFEIDESHTGTVLVSAAYYNALGSTQKLGLSVNGATVDDGWSFPSAGSWDTRMTTSEVAVTLGAGKNVITVTGNSSPGIRLDSISYGMGDYNFVCTVSNHCVDGMNLLVTVSP